MIREAHILHSLFLKEANETIELTSFQDDHCLACIDKKAGQPYAKHCHLSGEQDEVMIGYFNQELEENILEQQVALLFPGMENKSNEELVEHISQIMATKVTESERISLYQAVSDTSSFCGLILLHVQKMINDEPVFWSMFDKVVARVTELSPIVEKDKFREAANSSWWYEVKRQRRLPTEEKPAYLHYLPPATSTDVVDPFNVNVKAAVFYDQETLKMLSSEARQTVRDR